MKTTDRLDIALPIVILLMLIGPACLVIALVVQFFTRAETPLEIAGGLLTIGLFTSTISEVCMKRESRSYLVAKNSIWVSQFIVAGYGLFSLFQGQIRLGVILTGLGVIGVIVGKAGGFIWTVALHPALQALPGVISGYHVTKWVIKPLSAGLLGIWKRFLQKWAIWRSYTAKAADFARFYRHIFPKNRRDRSK